MLRKIVTTLVVVPAGVLLVVFMIANRHVVTVSLDPFGSGTPSLTATMPLFIVILLCLLIGVVAGGVAAWLRQAHWRRAARQHEAEVRALRSERDALRGRLAAREAPQPAPMPLSLTRNAG